MRRYPGIVPIVLFFMIGLFFTTLSSGAGLWVGWLFMAPMIICLFVWSMFIIVVVGIILSTIILTPLPRKRANS